ncbi:hypothetical protein [Mycolicibacterium cosmeticum]|uniref:PE-PGRS family protein n=1 Tax=Mycolicibacterium cosmeticum TaxID=258533 RepID=W9ATP1_MYCCO|nr:hypothetical protein [Mycolicibacterium cosmeticum]CDO05976.1 hypothetical protein BN977_00752 [Mycolicibacterium cosmeticum]
MRRPLAGAGGATACTCVLAASMVLVTDVPSPPRSAPPAVALAALPQPFTTTVPELVDRVSAFTALVDPLVPGDIQTTTSTTPIAAATPLATATSGPISYAFTQIVNAVVQGVLTLVAPAMNNPVLAPIVGPAVLFGGILAGLAVGTIYSVIVGIENAVGGALASIGAVLGQIFGLTAPLAITAAGAAPAPLAPTATATVADVPDAVTATDAVVAPRRHKAEPDTPGTVTLVDTDATDDDAGPSATPQPPAARQSAATDAEPETAAPSDEPKPAAPVKTRPKVRPSLGSPERPAQHASRSDGGGPKKGPKTSEVTAPAGAAPASGDDGSSPDAAAG